MSDKATTRNTIGQPATPAAGISPDLAFHAASEASRGNGRMDVLQTRVDVVTARYWLEDELSVIVKLWNRHGLKGWLRRSTGTAPFSRESAALRRLNSMSGLAPTLLGSFHLDKHRHHHTEALVLQDLGVCRDGFKSVKLCADEGRADAMAAINDEIIGLTVNLIDSSILDTDHRLTNMIVTDENRWYRIDFEHAHCVRHPDRHSRWLGEMLGRLLATYIFAVQPALEYVDEFAGRLEHLTKSNNRVRNYAEEIVVGMLESQYRNTGVKTAYAFSW